MQASYNITGGAAPAGSGLNVRLRINQAFAAVMSLNSGDSEPTETIAGMWWHDTLTGFLKQRNVTDDGWNIRWDMTKGQLATLYSPTFAGEVNLPTTTYIGGYPVARTTAPVFTGNSVFETLTAWSSVSLPASTTIGGVSPTELSYLDGVSSSIQSQLNAKQDALVSGTNIKTINGNSLLGSGNIAITQNPSSVFTNSQTFTASGTFTVPAGVTKLLVYMAGSGGGGGGGGGTTTSKGGGVGGGGASASYQAPIIIPVTPSTTISVTIGAGGSGGAGGSSSATAGGSGGTGGTTKFGSYSIVGGSGGGGGAAGGSGTGGGGGGGAGSFAGNYVSGGGAGAAGGDCPHSPITYYTLADGGNGACLINTGTSGLGGTSNGNNGSNGVRTGSAAGGAGGVGGAGEVTVYW